MAKPNQFLDYKDLKGLSAVPILDEGDEDWGQRFNDPRLNLKIRLPGGRIENMFNVSYNNGDLKITCRACGSSVIHGMNSLGSHYNGRSHQSKILRNPIVNEGKPAKGKASSICVRESTVGAVDETTLYMYRPSLSASREVLSMAPRQTHEPNIKEVIEEKLEAESQHRPLIGADTIVQITYPDTNSYSYYCTLCSRHENDDKDIVMHATSAEHTLLYLVIFFPTLGNMLKKLPSFEEDLYDPTTNAWEKAMEICSKLKEQFGPQHEIAMSLSKPDFDSQSFRDQIRDKVGRAKELPGFYFKEVVDFFQNILDEEELKQYEKFEASIPRLEEEEPNDVMQEKPSSPRPEPFAGKAKRSKIKFSLSKAQEKKSLESKIESFKSRETHAKLLDSVAAPSHSGEKRDLPITEEKEVPLRRISPQEKVRSPNQIPYVPTSMERKSSAEKYQRSSPNGEPYVRRKRSPERYRHSSPNEDSYTRRPKERKKSSERYRRSSLNEDPYVRRMSPETYRRSSPNEELNVRRMSAERYRRSSPDEEPYVRRLSPETYRRSSPDEELYVRRTKDRKKSPERYLLSSSKEQVEENPSTARFYDDMQRGYEDGVRGQLYPSREDVINRRFGANTLKEKFVRDDSVNKEELYVQRLSKVGEDVRRSLGEPTYDSILGGRISGMASMKDGFLNTIGQGTGLQDQSDQSKVHNIWAEAEAKHEKRWYTIMDRPDSYPNYADKWNKWYGQRYKELKQEGKNPEQHDFNKEWLGVWKNYLTGQKAREWESIKINLKRQEVILERERGLKRGHSPEKRNAEAILPGEVSLNRGYSPEKRNTEAILPGLKREYSPEKKNAETVLQEEKILKKGHSPEKRNVEAILQGERILKKGNPPEMRFIDTILQGKKRKHSPERAFGIEDGRILSASRSVDTASTTSNSLFIRPKRSSLIFDLGDKMLDFAISSSEVESPTENSSSVSQALSLAEAIYQQIGQPTHLITGLLEAVSDLSSHSLKRRLEEASYQKGLQALARDLLNRKSDCGQHLQGDVSRCLMMLHNVIN